MFTGIVQSVGNIVSTEPRGGDVRIAIASPTMDWSDTQVGDSIATNGVCLTAAQLTGSGFFADVSLETLSLTTVGQWQVGDKVNLEQALTPQSRLGGHIVSGHIDGIGEVLDRATDARSEQFRIRAPAPLAKYIAQKGSIAVDGISLTVNMVEGDFFCLNIVPHTLAHTTIGDYVAGSFVNLEVDVIARYLERLLMGGQATKPLSEAFLAEHGYLKK